MDGRARSCSIQSRSLQEKAGGVVVEITAMLDGDPERLGEVNRVEQVPAVADAAVAGRVTLPAGLAEPGPRSRAESPGVVEVVFAAGPLETGDRLAVDIEEVVALA